MVEYLPRSAWNARKANAGPGDLTPSRVEGVVIHWPGTGDDKPIHTREAVAAALRGWQDYHIDTRGWSDIAYQVAVDQSGRAWTLRGLLEQSGANGCNAVNETYGAILLVLVDGEEPSEAMKATTREVITDFRRIYGADAAQIKPHSVARLVCDTGGTDCPGDAARAAIVRGDFEPWADHPTPPPGDDMPTPAELEHIQKKYVLADQLWRSQTAAEQAVSNALATKLLASGMAPAAVVAEVEKLWKPTQVALQKQLEDLG
jgi:hypothetical protein